MYTAAAKPVLGFYPFVLATVLVTSHPLGAVTWFPVLFIGSATYALGMCLFVARSRDLQVRRLKWHELIVMAMLGASSVMIYDLLYVVPVFTAAFIVCRCVAGGYSLRLLPRTAAAARWLALSVGFTVVFTAVRLEIASRCGIHDCYDAANVNLPRGGLLDRIVELTAARVLTGSPPAGWVYNADPDRLLRHFIAGGGGCGLAPECELPINSDGLRFTLADLAANSLGFALLLTIAALLVAGFFIVWRAAGGCYRGAVTVSVKCAAEESAVGACKASSCRSKTQTGNSAAASSAVAADDSALGGIRDYKSGDNGLFGVLRFSAGLGFFGMIVTLPPALLVSLSERIQSLHPPVGYAWRDTLMVQIGWSFMITAVIGAALAVVGLISDRDSRKLARALIGNKRHDQTSADVQARFGTDTRERFDAQEKQPQPSMQGRIAVMVIAVLLGGGMVMTLLSKERLAHVDRSAPLSSVTNLISQASINPVDTDTANVYRCSLIDWYTKLNPGTGWLDGPAVHKQLDRLMLSRHGWPFCDFASIE